MKREKSLVGQPCTEEYLIQIQRNGTNVMSDFCTFSSSHVIVEMTQLLLSPPLEPSLHDTALGLQLVSPALLAGTHVEAHVALLVQVEQLLEELGDIVVGLS